MSALFQSLLRRFGFGEQTSRPTVHRPQVRLCLEALGERTQALFGHARLPWLNSQTATSALQALRHNDRVLLHGGPTPGST